jgi:hypothetical protein
LLREKTLTNEVQATPLSEHGVPPSDWDCVDATHTLSVVLFKQARLSNRRRALSAASSSGEKFGQIENTALPREKANENHIENKVSKRNLSIRYFEKCIWLLHATRTLDAVNATLQLNIHKTARLHDSSALPKQRE